MPVHNQQTEGMGFDYQGRETFAVIIYFYYMVTYIYLRSQCAIEEEMNRDGQSSSLFLIPLKKEPSFSFYCGDEPHSRWSGWLRIGLWIVIMTLWCSCVPAGIRRQKLSLPRGVNSLWRDPWGCGSASTCFSFMSALLAIAFIWIGLAHCFICWCWYIFVVSFFLLTRIRFLREISY